MRKETKKQKLVRTINQAESIKQPFLRYGLSIAEQAKSIFLKGGWKKLKEFEKICVKK